VHLQGKSTMKGTAAVLEAWHRWPDLPPLTLITHTRGPLTPNGVRVVIRPPHDRLVRELNAAEIHVCPSVNEGWGHYITEGLSVGATVVTTDASPMNELVPAERRIVCGGRRRLEFPEHHVDPDALADAIRHAADLSRLNRERYSTAARMHVAARTEMFRQTALDLLERLPCMQAS
jgi:glycosyltransferase involved in cell wall biosynthesis